MSKFAPALKATEHAASRPPQPRTTAPHGRGRPRGGRSGDRANYQPLTVYISRDVHGEVAGRLARDRRQFSEVIENLLRRWLKHPDLA